jgi:hypothetical protein
LYSYCCIDFVKPKKVAATTPTAPASAGRKINLSLSRRRGCQLLVYKRRRWGYDVTNPGCAESSATESQEKHPPQPGDMVSQVACISCAMSIIIWGWDRAHCDISAPSTTFVQYLILHQKRRQNTLTLRQRLSVGNSNMVRTNRPLRSTASVSLSSRRFEQ